MTLTIELTPEQEKRLIEKARARGVRPQEIAQRLVMEGLLPEAARAEQTAHVPTAKTNRTLRGYGLFANSPRSVEDFERESREETRREEREFREAQA